MEYERQSEALKRLLMKGLRLSKREIRERLGIENVGRCIEELRRAGLPIATVWCDKDTGLPVLDDAGRMVAWTGERLLGHALTRQPANSYAEYKLCCKDCGTVDNAKLGWRWLRETEGFYLGEFAETFQCIACLSDAMCSV